MWRFGEFGHALAVDGDQLIIADHGDDSACPCCVSCNSGAVYVLGRDAGGNWALRQRLVSTDIAEQHGFGNAVALHADRLVVGAPGVSTLEHKDGAAYIFERAGGAWQEATKLLPPRAQDQSCFGCAVALVDDWAFIGAFNIVAPGVGAAGAVFVYQRDGADWRHVQTLVPPDPTLSMRFGAAIAADGDAIVVGAPAHDVGAMTTGAAYVYRLVDGEWGFEARLNGEPRTILLGDSVSISGDAIAAGAPSDADPFKSAGAVFIFERDAGGEWRQTARVQPSEPGIENKFGSSVALADGILYAGAPLRFTPAGDGRGAVFAFRRDFGGDWKQINRLDPPPGMGARFGRALAVGGGVVAVGDDEAWVGAFEQAGMAHTFEIACAVCRADLDGDGELTFFDFLAFQNLFAAGDPRADFDSDGALTFFDFLAFQDEFAAGCG